jgi:predicted nucleotidyltransferase
MLDTIQAKRDDLYAVAKKHKAEKLWVFGSCAGKEETPDSDVDLLVQFSNGGRYSSQVF